MTQSTFPQLAMPIGVKAPLDSEKTEVQNHAIPIWDAVDQNFLGQSIEGGSTGGGPTFVTSTVAEGADTSAALASHLAATDPHGDRAWAAGEFANGNAIINGDFRVNQRGVSSPVTLSSYQYGHDRWKAVSGGCVYSFATTNGKTTLFISSGYFEQIVEAVNVPSGTTLCTLSWEGTAHGSIASGSFAASPITQLITGGSDLHISFGTGTLANVKLEIGSVATRFESRPYGQELALCQGYYFKEKLVWGAGPTTGVITVGFGFSYPCRMRAAPTLTITNNVSIGSIGSISINATDSMGSSISATATGVGAYIIQCNVTGDAEL